MKQVLIDAAVTGLAFFIGAFVIALILPVARKYLT